MELTFVCTDQSLTRTDNNILAANSINFVMATFKFDDSWNGYAKSAVFEKDDVSVKQILDYNDTCYVPSKVLGEGWFNVSLIGVMDGTGIQANMSFRATSNCVDIEVLKGGSPDVNNASVPALTDIEQLELKAQAAADSAADAKSIADSVRADADAGKFNGEVGATPNITIGAVTTLDAGEEVTVEITGTAEDPVLNISIPRGMDGESLYVISTKDELDLRAKSLVRISETATINVLWIGDDTTVADTTLKAFSSYSVTYIRKPTVVIYSSVEMRKSLNPINVTTDTELSEISNNPIANSVVAKEIKTINEAIGGLNTWLESI